MTIPDRAPTATGIGERAADAAAHAAPLPRVRGRRARVALLVNRDADTDSRVLKTAATLRAAGADVIVLGSARERAGFPAGHAFSPDGIPLHRSPDLELAAIFSRTARVWRALRGRSSPSTSPPPPSPLDRAEPSASAPSAAGGPPVRHGAAVRALGADVWMRSYQAGRLGYYWLGAVRVGRAWRPDVVHANDGNTLVPAMALRLLVGARIVYDAHELWTERNVRQDRWVAPAVEAGLERVGVRCSDGVITVSPSIVRWMQHRFALAEAPTLVRNVPHSRGPVPDPAAGRLRKLTGLPPEASVVAYCGGITTGRGLEETVEALVYLPDDVHLVLLGFGDEQYVTGLLGQAEGQGVGDRVHLAGQVPGPEVPQALADADVAVVFVRPICLSYRFSLPNKLFESIHAGLPIVAADLPDTAAVVRELGVGAVFEGEEPADLAAAIREVLADPGGYRAAARAAAQTVDWTVEAGRLLALYRQVLAQVDGARS